MSWHCSQAFTLGIFLTCAQWQLVKFKWKALFSVPHLLFCFFSSCLSLYSLSSSSVLVHHFFFSSFQQSAVGVLAVKAHTGWLWHWVCFSLAFSSILSLFYVCFITSLSPTITHPVLRALSRCVCLTTKFLFLKTKHSSTRFSLMGLSQTHMCLWQGHFRP